jgi:hypothetical protein
MSEQLLNKPEIEFRATRWRVLREFYPAYGRRLGEIYIEEVRQSETDPSAVRYAVRMNHWAWSKSGKWDFEPRPSERTEAWLDKHRWDDLESAHAAAAKAAAKMLKEGDRIAREAAERPMDIG